MPVTTPEKSAECDAFDASAAALDAELEDAAARALAADAFFEETIERPRDVTCFEDAVIRPEDPFLTIATINPIPSEEGDEADAAHARAMGVEHPARAPTIEEYAKRVRRVHEPLFKFEHAPPQSPPLPMPKVGRIVHYYVRGNRNETRPVPAIITATLADTPDHVNLFVMNDPISSFVRDVGRTDHKKAGCWNWPPRD